MHVHNTNLLPQLVIRVNSQTSQKTLDRQNYFFNQRTALLLIEYPSIFFSQLSFRPSIYLRQNGISDANKNVFVYMHNVNVTILGI